MNAKRIFILGAGFSRQAGMPLATELTNCLLQKHREDNPQEMNEWYNFLKQRISWLEKASGEKSVAINIEQVFDLARFDVELWKMRQHLCPVGRQWGDTPSNSADSIETWLSDLQDDLIDVIWEKQEQAKQKLKLISRFSQNLQQDDVVLTFNYDTLLENSLTDQKKAWCYGFEREKGNGISILKMHGSINWAIVLRNQYKNFGYTLLFRKEDKNINENNAKPSGEREYDYVLLHIPDNSLKNRIENRILQKGCKQYSIGIAGLGSYKPLHMLHGSGEVWFNAIKALREAEEICVVGFSLSPFDNMSRLHFGGVMCERAEKGNLPKKVVLIDPSADKPEFKRNFHSVFGGSTPIQFYSEKAEKVDWAQLLGY